MQSSPLHQAPLAHTSPLPPRPGQLEPPSVLLRLSHTVTTSLANCSASLCIALLIDSDSAEGQELSTLRLRQLIRQGDKEIEDPMLLGAVAGIAMSVLDSAGPPRAIDSLPAPITDEQRQLRSEMRLLLREVGRSPGLLTHLGEDHCHRLFRVLVANIDAVAPSYRPFVESVARLYAPSRVRTIASEAPATKLAKRFAEPEEIERIIRSTQLSELSGDLDPALSPAHLEWAMLRIRQLARKGISAPAPAIEKIANSLLTLAGSNPGQGHASELHDVGIRFDALETLRRLGLGGYTKQLDSASRDSIVSKAANLLYALPLELRSFNDEVACRL